MKLTERQKEFLKICGLKGRWGARRIAQVCRDYAYIGSFRRLENAEQFLSKYSLGHEDYTFFVYNLLRLMINYDERA